MSSRSLSSVRARTGVREAVGLGAVDVALIAGLVTYGHVHHGGDPLAEPVAAVETVAPFLLGWVAASLLAGLYRRSVARDPASSARLITLCWLAAANVGLIVRDSPFVEGGTAYPFTLVMTGFGLLALLPWRVGYAAIVGRSA